MTTTPGAHRVQPSPTGHDTPSSTTPATSNTRSRTRASARSTRSTARRKDQSQVPDGYMTADMIAADLARITGKKHVPSSTIRGMASRGQIPAPTGLKWGRRILWDAAEVEEWLAEREAKHVPKSVIRQVQRNLTALDEQARASGNDARLKQGVRNAYRRGLSFQQIADAIKVKNGDHHPTREAVRSRFGPYI